MPVLTAVRVSITDDVVFVVIDGEMAINLVVLVDSIVDTVLICVEDCWIVFIALVNNVLVYIFEVLTTGGLSDSNVPLESALARTLLFDPLLTGNDVDLVSFTDP